MKRSLTGIVVLIILACRLGPVGAYSGEPDETFGNNGLLFLTSDGGSSLDFGSDILARSDGKFYVLGVRKACSVLLRRDADGTPDESFNADGTPGEFRLCSLGAGSVSALALQADGKILVLGSIGGKMSVLRILEGGGLDPEFNASGPLPGTSSVSVAASFGFQLAVQPDGKILAFGVRGGPEQFGFLARWTADGRPDARFGGGGEILFDDRPMSESLGYGGLAVQGDGSIVAGYTEDFFSEDVTGLVFGLLSNGMRNPLFNGGGVAQPTEEEEITVNKLALQKDGKILVTGKLMDGGADYAYIGRLTAFGFPDTGGYGGSWGRSTIPLEPHHSGVDLAVQDDGKALLLGKMNNRFFLLARFTEGGFPDPSFGDQGVQILEAGYDFSASAMDLLPDGKILAVGTANKDIVVARFRGDPAAPKDEPAKEETENNPGDPSGGTGFGTPASVPGAAGCSLRKELP